jgi:hypothetical protein
MRAVQMGVAQMGKFLLPRQAENYLALENHRGRNLKKSFDTWGCCPLVKDLLRHQDYCPQRTFRIDRILAGKSRRMACWINWEGTGIVGVAATL